MTVDQSTVVEEKRRFFLSFQLCSVAACSFPACSLQVAGCSLSSMVGLLDSGSWLPACGIWQGEALVRVPVPAGKVFLAGASTIQLLHLFANCRTLSHFAGLCCTHGFWIGFRLDV